MQEQDSIDYIVLCMYVENTVDGSKKIGSSCIYILLEIVAKSENRKSPKTFFYT